MHLILLSLQVPISRETSYVLSIYGLDFQFYTHQQFEIILLYISLLLRRKLLQFYLRTVLLLLAR
jgi:hypothetical protein